MAQTQHICTGCVPIDAAIIDVYVQLLSANTRANEAAERAEHAAEAAIGKSPYIGENGDWWEWNDEQGAFIDTGVQAHGSIVVDYELSTTSTNPVQNKVITEELNKKYTMPIGGIPTEDIVDTNSQMTQAQINQIVIGGNITVNLSASPSPIFVGAQRTISLSATCSAAATIVIKKGSIVLATGSGTSLSASDTITPDSAGNTSSCRGIGGFISSCNFSSSGTTQDRISFCCARVHAEFTIGSIHKTASRSVTAVYPIRIGTGTEYVDGTPLTTPKTSPAGTYNVTVANDGEYVYFNVPSTMTINGATMGGFEFPLEAPASKTIGGVSYKSYRSSNTYDAGTLTIVIS